MILFIVEGKTAEPRLIEAMHRVYPELGEHIVSVYGTDIYTLYKELKKDDFLDILPLMQQRCTDEKHPIHKIKSRDEVESVYLFFDYDFHNRTLSKEKLDQRLNKMLSLFDNETDMGKLYVSYPMIEALQHTDKPELSDVCRREDCSTYKEKVNRDCPSTLNIIAPASNEKNPDLSLWTKIIKHNIQKAHDLCCGQYTFPKKKEDIAQGRIFECQLNRHVEPHDRVAILSALPLFLYEYFDINKFV